MARKKSDDAAPAGDAVEIIDQTRFPHRFEIVTLLSMHDAAHAIKAMLVRGAPLIGATAAYGVGSSYQEIDPDEIPALYRQCDVGLVCLDPRHRTHSQ